jgi:hypothetical protein
MIKTSNQRLDLRCTNSNAENKKYEETRNMTWQVPTCSAATPPRHHTLGLCPHKQTLMIVKWMKSQRIQNNDYKNDQ